MSATYNDVLGDTWRPWNGREERVANNQRAGFGLLLLLQMGSGLIDTLSSISNAPFNLFAQGTSSINAQVEQILRQLVLRQVAIPHPSKVRSYLVKNSDLLNLLPPLCEDVTRSFSPNTKLSLEYYEDPQFGNDHYLCLYLKSAALDNSAVETIDNITDAYSEAFAKVKGWILIIPDFRHY